MTANNKRQTAKTDGPKGASLRGKGPKKPAARLVPSDDCVVTVDGVEYHPHEGECIEVIPIAQLEDLRIMRELNGVRPQLDTVKDEPDQRAREIEILSKAFEIAVDVLGHRIVAWNWTDMAGNPMASPAEDPNVLRRLSFEEVFYLVDAIQGETPGEQKNGSRPSRTSGSATAPQPSQG